MAEDHDSTMWFTQNESIVNYNIKTGELIDYTNNANNPNSFPARSAERIIVDTNGNIWVGTSQEGVVLFDKKSKTFTHFEAGEDSNSLAENYVERVYEDPNQNIWITHNNNGISKYNPHANSFIRYFPDPSIKESGRVRGIVKDNSGNFWIGTQAGLYLFDETNESFLRYASIEHPTSRLSHNSIQNIMLDNQDGLWIGTFAGGVSYANLNTSGFTHYSYSPIANEYFLNDKNVYSIAVDHANNVWVGTENGGLNYLDRTTGKLNYYLFDPENPHSLRSNNIKSILVGRNNNIWIGTYRGGMAFFNSENQEFTNYLPDPQDSLSIHSNAVYTINHDPIDPHTIWIGTDKGLTVFNDSSESFYRVNHKYLGIKNVPDVLISNRIFDIKIYNGDKLVIGSNGLSIYDKQKNDIKLVESVSGISINSVPFLLVDKSGALWFYSDHNLFRLNNEGSSYDVFTEEDGFPHVDFLSAQDDEHGNIWFSSDKGLFKFENLVHNQDTLIYESFDKSDNLQSIEFLYGSNAISSDNELFFGGINGLNSFFASKVKKNPYAPKVQISELLIENKKVEAGDEIYGEILLYKDILETENLDIYYKTKSITLKFNALHYSAPESNQLAYILEGYENEWNYVNGSEGVAMYTNLPHGDYIFKVKGANNNGLWNDEPEIIRIHISPPFYKTIWFYLLIISITGSAVYFLIKYREKHLKRDRETLQNAIDEKTVELDKIKEDIISKNEAEKIKNWFNEEVKELNKVINTNKKDIRTMGNAVLKYLNKTLEIHQGAILLLNDDDPEDKYLQIASSFAYDAEKLEKNRWELDEGLVGAAFKNGEKLHVDNVPGDYTKISSGLGQTTPSYLLLIPIQIDEENLGILELCGINNLSDHQIELLEVLVENMASTIFIFKSNQRTNELLIQSTNQTEELKAQQEEMRQNMEELEATTENFKRKEQELENKIGELEAKLELN